VIITTTKHTPFHLSRPLAHRSYARERDVTVSLNGNGLILEQLPKHNPYGPCLCIKQRLLFFISCCSLSLFHLCLIRLHLIDRDRFHLRAAVSISLF